MAAWVCTECTTTYSVGAPRCPHCGSTEHAEEGAEDMAKIRVHGGVSDANAEPEPKAGEDVSVGSSSETSSEKPESSPETSEQPSPSPAPTTGSRSKKAATAKARTARGTGGGQAADTSVADEEA